MYKKDLRKAIANVSQNKRLRAIALEVINKRASVKISGSSQLLYDLPIVGGDIVAGQEVYVDYTTGQPIVHSYTESDLSDVSVSRVRTRVIIPDPDVPLSGSDHTHIETQITDLTHSATKIRGRTITTGSPVDGDTLLWNATGGSWVYGAGGEVDEAPIDGAIYGRKDGTWEEFTIPEIETGSIIAVRAYRGTTQSIPTATLTKIEFTSVQKDDGNIWDIGDPTKFTAPATGWYLINGWVDWAKDSTVTGRRQLFVYFNDVTQLTEYAHMTADIVQKGPTQSVSILVHIPAGNYIDFRVYQNRGSNLDISFAAASMILINSEANYTGGTSGSVITLTDHNDLENIGINTHTQIDEALTRLLNTSGLNTGDQDLSSYLTDSPIDAKIYGRSSGSWVEVTNSPTGGSSVISTTIQDKIMFSIDGEITTGSSPLRIYNATGVSRRLDSVFVSVDIPSSGSTPITIDILKNGVSIFSAGEKPSISAGSYTDSSDSLDITSWADGEYLVMSIDSIGNITPGESLVVQVLYSVEDIPIEYTSITIENPSLSLTDQCFFSIEGEVTTGSNPLQIYNTSGSSRTISKVHVYANTPSSGSNIIIDVLKNGSSIFTSGSNMAIVLSGQNTGETEAIGVTEWASGESLTINVIEAGTDTENVVVQVIFTKDIGSEGGTTGGVTDHTELTNIGVNTHDQIDTALTRLAGTSGSNTGDQDLSDYLTDANSDGKTYGRKDGNWAQIISSGSGGGIEEAPIDGKQYGRQDAGWTEIVSGSSGGGEEYALSDLTDISISGSVTTGQILSYNDVSSLWSPVYWQSPYTQPPKGVWNWVNEGTATVDESGFGIYLYAPPQSGPSFRIRYKELPETPYTITACIVPMTYDQNYNRVGLCWTESTSGSGKITIFCIGSQNGSQDMGVQNENSAISWNSNVLSSIIAFPPSPIWLRLSDNNTNRICSWSADGIHFIDFYTVSRTTWITPQAVGIFACSENTTYGCGMTLLSWKEE